MDVNQKSTEGQGLRAADRVSRTQQESVLMDGSIVASLVVLKDCVAAGRRAQFVGRVSVSSYVLDMTGRRSLEVANLPATVVGWRTNAVRRQ